MGKLFAQRITSENVKVEMVWFWNSANKSKITMNWITKPEKRE